MCGICGATRASETLLGAMNAAMVHRGPDDEGIHIDQGVGIGARRLSIIDVEGGHQPLSNEDGTVWAVLNGEIYNHPSLMKKLRARGHVFSTHADTEVLVHLYEDYGTDLAHALEGMYAFAIWDATKRVLLLGRDRFGEKPLFYAERNGDLVFASELTALAAGQRTSEWELDPLALDSYFRFGYVTGPGTIVRGVKQLAPGSILVWQASDGKTTTSRYWEPPESAQSDGTPLSELVDEARELLERSMRGRLISDVPLGVFLSGGVDSMLVATLAARLSNETVKTFTVGYDTGSVNETKPAREAASMIGTEHRELVLTQPDVAECVPRFIRELDQPLADQALIPLRALAHFARSEVKVAVGGEGADELFGGYPRYRWLAHAEMLPGWLPRRGAAAAANAMARLPGTSRVGRLADVLAPGDPFERHENWVTNRRADSRARLYGPRLREWLADSSRSSRVAIAPSANGVAGTLMRLDQMQWLPDDVLAKADRATMRASLEFRTPFLSRELAEFAASVPASIHLRVGGKLLLRKVLRELLPEAPHRRSKTGFRAPAASWLRAPLAPLLDGQLDSSALYADGWVERTAVSELVEEHRQGADQSDVLWPLFVLATWMDGSRAGARA